MKQELQDEMFEAMLRSAFRDHCEEEELPTEEELRAMGVEPHRFSPEFEKKMEKLIKKMRRKEWREKHRRGIRQLAAMLAVVFLAGGILVTQVDAFRVPVMSVIITIGERFSEIVVKDSAQRNIPSNEFHSRLPNYMPDGFYVESVDEDKDSCTVFCSDNSESYYSIDYYTSAADTSIDTENAIVSEQEIRGQPAIIAEKDGSTIIVWYPNGHEYILSGTISVEEMIRILESIENVF